MWWVILLLVLSGCSAQMPVQNVTLDNSTPQNNTVLNMSVVESDVLTEKENSTVLQNESINNINNTSMANETNLTETPVYNESLELSGNFIRFYLSTIDGMKNVALSEGMKVNVSGAVVEVVFISSSGGAPKVLLRIDGDLSSPLEEKESEIVGGNYVFIMEILYKS